MKSERLVILVTPAQKRAFARRAKALDVSVAELLRRSTEDTGTGRDEQQLAALAGDLQRAVRDSRTALRAALSEAETTLRQLSRHRREKRVA